jgi:hypothetical protein
LQQRHFFSPKGEPMKKLTIAVALFAALTVGVYAAFATEGAHFMSSSSSVNDDGALVVNWDEAGLGNGDITYTLTADATALYACINNGGHHPKASNKESFQGSVSTGGSFQAKNGRVRASLTAGPLTEPAFTCPSGQTRVLAQASTRTSCSRTRRTTSPKTSPTRAGASSRTSRTSARRQLAPTTAVAGCLFAPSQTTRRGPRRPPAHCCRERV